MIKVKAPGKLYIAGEYAVLESGHPAIIVALNHYIEAQIQENHNIGSITSAYSENQPINWYRDQNKAKLKHKNKDFRYVMTAINIAEMYVTALGKKLKFFDLTITSALDNKNGKKYGFGSSGAVTVATIKAVLKFYDIKLTHDLVYKLSVLTHLKLKENGSFGDIAASTYGGWIAYSTFDKTWLLNKIEEVPFTELIHTQWSKLRIEPLPKPDLKLLIGWTGNPASTTALIDQIKDDLNKHTFSELKYEQFLSLAKEIVEDMIQSFYNKNYKKICEGLNQYRNLLLEFSKLVQIKIETPDLHNLCTAAQNLNIAAKSSGAGGGDCGIALLNSSDNISKLTNSWKKLGITPLTDIDVYYEKEGDFYDK